MDEGPTKNSESVPCIALVHSYVCLGCVCVCVCVCVGGWVDWWVGGWGGGGGGGMSEADHRPPSPVICKSHEL